MNLIPGKWYVIDLFSTYGEPTSGPFDTEAEAEDERSAINIADDCIVRRAQYRVPLCNVQTLGASAGFGFGRTKEEAIANAIALANETDPEARYNPSTGTVDFAGGINC